MQRNSSRLLTRNGRCLTGTFEVGVLPTIAPYLIPRFFPQLMNEHPEMDVRITEMKPRICAGHFVGAI